MNKKGFTLVELLAVIAIIGVIAAIATPNIIALIDNGKKEQYVADAKELISKAKYYNKQEKYKDLFIVDGACKVITAKKLGFSKEKTVDDTLYDLDNSKVKVCLESNTYVYYVVTITKTDNNNGRSIYNSKNIGGYVKETELKVESVS